MIPARIAVSAGVAASARELSPATASVGRAFRATASAGNCPTPDGTPAGTSGTITEGRDA